MLSLLRNSYQNSDNELITQVRLASDGGAHVEPMVLAACRFCAQTANLRAPTEAIRKCGKPRGIWTRGRCHAKLSKASFLMEMLPNHHLARAARDHGCRFTKDRLDVAVRPSGKDFAVPRCARRHSVRYRATRCAQGARAILVAPAQLREPMPMRCQIAPRFCSTQRTARFAGPQENRRHETRCVASGAAQW